LIEEIPLKIIIWESRYDYCASHGRIETLAERRFCFYSTLFRANNSSIIEDLEYIISKASLTHL
jgi:hypothetical protein